MIKLAGRGNLETIINNPAVKINSFYFIIFHFSFSTLFFFPSTHD